MKKKLCAIDNESKKYVEKINNKKTFLRKSFESMEKITFFKGPTAKLKPQFKENLVESQAKQIL